jgi:hypothetical protein
VLTKNQKQSINSLATLWQSTSYVNGCFMPSRSVSFNWRDRDQPSVYMYLPSGQNRPKTSRDLSIIPAREGKHVDRARPPDRRSCEPFSSQDLISPFHLVGFVCHLTPPDPAFASARSCLFIQQPTSFIHRAGCCIPCIRCIIDWSSGEVLYTGQILSLPCIPSILSS